MTITLAEYQAYYDDLSVNNTDKFNRLLTQAESLISSLTAGRSEDVAESTDFRYDQLKKCLIQTVHYLNTADPVGMAGIKSASNDGYSETYSSAMETTVELKELVADWLSGTGLAGCW